MSDDNKVKLLKIQHALLEALSEKKIHASTEEERDRIANELSVNLLKYKELVTEIEHNIYLELQDKLIKLTETSLSLEEEVIKLEEIETFYNQLIEIQTRFKQTYSIYSKEDLILSDNSLLNIELYLNRKEAIKAYLINKKNIADNKKQIEKINDELINEEQKEERIDKKITFLDEELIRRLLTSEGRHLNIENDQEKLKYTSIVTEYQDIGVYLEKNGYTGKSIDEFTTAANETKEKLMAATISYEVLPNYENKKILDEISLENITANYHLVMAKILIEIYNSSKNTDGAIQKRERIKDLLKYRQTYLTNLGIKHAADPFARLHINEQLEELKKYENNSRSISRLRRALAELNERIETLTADNIQYVASLEESELAITNRKIDTSSELSIPKFNDYIVDIKPAEVRVLDNQITNITDVNSNFNHKKCQEITSRVIKKVYEILMHPENNMPTEKAPELVIEQMIPSKEKDKDEVKQTSEEKDSVLSNDIFSKTEPFVPNFEIPMPTFELTDETNDIVSNPELIIEPKVAELPKSNQSTEKTEETSEEKDYVLTNDIFSKTEPFVPNFEISTPIVEISNETNDMNSNPELVVETDVNDSSKPIEDHTSEETSEENTNSEQPVDFIMPELQLDTSQTTMNVDIFSDITPFETPTMFTEKVDSDEPEQIFPSNSLKLDKQPEPTKIFNEMPVVLEEKEQTNESFDFWSTDANINNISSQQNENLVIHRKGI